MIRHPARAKAASRIAEAERQAHLANGSGRSWNFITLLVVPFPPSMWNGARVLMVVHKPRPFQPPLGSSNPPSIPFVENPIGYGTRITTQLPSLSASSPSDALPVLIGV